MYASAVDFCRTTMNHSLHFPSKIYIDQAQMTNGS